MVQAEQIEEQIKEEEPFGLGCALENFSEHEEVFRAIQNLENLVVGDVSSIEKAYERFSFILSQYIEQPHLIDSHIDLLLKEMIEIIRSPDNSMELKHLTFKYMFVVVNVRGYKVIVRHLPHEVQNKTQTLKDSFRLTNFVAGGRFRAHSAAVRVAESRRCRYLDHSLHFAAVDVHHRDDPIPYVPFRWVRRNYHRGTENCHGQGLGCYKNVPFGS